MTVSCSVLDLGSIKSEYRTLRENLSATSDLFVGDLRLLQEESIGL
jgi:hypothetical protein